MKNISINSINKISKLDDDLTLVIGTFDGMHIGHQKLFFKAKKIAKSKVGIFVVNYIGKENLFSLEDRFIQSQKYGFDFFITFDLNSKNRNLSYVNFENILKKLGCKNIIIGKDFHYGKDRVGNYKTLEKSFNVFVEDFEKYKGEKISSTLIKKIVKKGDIKIANKLLGKPYQIKGKVQKGFGKGKIIGFPTINIDLDFDYVLPKNGVYKSIVYILGIPHICLTNVGTHPTINKLKEPICETYILNFNSSIYGKTVYLQFDDFIREEKKFNSIENLKKQIEKDIKKL